MGSARFVESLLSFAVTHYISLFTNCPISTPELNGIVKPGASKPGLSPGHELPGPQRPAFGGGSGDSWLGQALHSAKEVGLFSLNLRE